MENNNEQYQEWEKLLKKRTRKNRFLILIMLGFLMLLAFIFFKSTSYVESGNFCTICHDMKPYHYSWQQSSHKNVACFQCHFGKIEKVPVKPIPVTNKQYWNIELGSRTINVSPYMSKIKGYALRFNHYVDKIHADWIYSKLIFSKYSQIVEMMAGGRKTGATITWTNCTSCHPDIAKNNAKADSTGHTRHLTIGLTCQKCHGDVAHENVVKFERADCMKCHASGMPKPKSHGTLAFTESHGKLYLKRDSCRICHVKGTKEKVCMDCHGIEIPHPKNFASIHVQTIKKTDIRKCVNCHSEEDPEQLKINSGLKKIQPKVKGIKSTRTCADCHGKGFPHYGKKGLAVINVHGQQVKTKGVNSCLTCHNKNQCTDCHGVEVPHPKGFITVHVKLYNAGKGNECIRCHINGKGSAPKCYECHGLTLPHPTDFLLNHGQEDKAKCVLCHSPKNPVNPRSSRASPKFCTNCHNTPKHFAGHWNNTGISACARCHFDTATCSIKCH